MVVVLLRSYCVALSLHRMVAQKLDRLVFDADGLILSQTSRVYPVVPIDTDHLHSILPSMLMTQPSIAAMSESSGRTSNACVMECWIISAKHGSFVDTVGLLEEVDATGVNVFPHAHSQHSIPRSDPASVAFLLPSPFTKDVSASSLTSRANTHLHGHILVRTATTRRPGDDRMPGESGWMATVYELSVRGCCPRTTTKQNHLPNRNSQSVDSGRQKTNIPQLTGA